MSNLTNKSYSRMAKDASPPTKSYKTIPLAFISGGVICVIGQAFINLYRYMGMAQDTASTTASITLVFIAIALTGLHVYDNIAKHAGAGTIVPITGFANAVCSPALEFKTEGLIMGLGAKMFTIAGPVIVYGMAAGVIYGIIIYMFRLY